MHELTHAVGNLTQGMAEQSIVLEPHHLYSRIIENREASCSITLEDAASGNHAPSSAGVCRDDSLPSTFMGERATGILPPASESEIQATKLKNKNATRAERLRRLLLTGSLTLDDTKGYRIRTAYRLVRHMMRVRGILDGWERIQPVLDSQPDGIGVSLWTLPRRLNPSGFLTGYRGVRAILHHSEQSSYRYTLNTDDGYRAFKGSTTLPPPIPDQLYPVKSPEELWGWRLSRRVPEDYNPEQDLPLILYCEAMTILAEQMGIPRGAPEEPWAGEYGLAGLLNPTIARQAWPTRDELCMYEDELILHIYDKLTENSQRNTEIYLQQYFGFSRFEAVDMAKTALAAGSVLYAVSAEEERAAIIRRVENIADDCQLASDPRAEFSAIKFKSQLLGLTAEAGDETMAELREAAMNAHQYRLEEE